MYFRSHFIHYFQPLVKLQNCSNGNTTVNSKNRHDNAEQHNPQNVRDHGDALVDDRMNHIHNECTCKSPVDGKFQTHISMQIEWLVAVIPPLVVKHFFQNKSGNVFQNGSQ